MVSQADWGPGRGLKSQSPHSLKIFCPKEKETRNIKIRLWHTGFQVHLNKLFRIQIYWLYGSLTFTRFTWLVSPMTSFWWTSTLYSHQHYHRLNCSKPFKIMALFHICFLLGVRRFIFMQWFLLPLVITYYRTNVTVHYVYILIILTSRAMACSWWWWRHS